MNTNKQLILLKKNSFFYLFLKKYDSNLKSDQHFFTIYSHSDRFFLELNTREPQRHVSRSGSISVGQLTAMKSGASGIMQTFNVEDIHGEDT